MYKRLYDGMIALVHFLGRSIKQFIVDGCTYRAAALTYTTLLAIVPLTVVALKIFSYFPTYQYILVQLQDFIFNNFVVSTGEVVRKHLNVFALQALHSSWVGIIFLIITAILLIFTIEEALNYIWKVKKPRNTFLAFFSYWAVVAVGPILLGVSLFATSYLLSLPLLHNVSKTVGISLLQIFPILFTFLGFAFLYQAVPNCKVRSKDAFFGALIATILFEASKYFFAIYLKHIASYQLIYGVFATIPIFLLWLYIGWLVTLFGAIMSYQFAQRSSLIAGTQHE